MTTPEEKLFALSSQICSKIKVHLRIWYEDKKAYAQNINDLETFFNKLVSGKGKGQLLLSANLNGDVNTLLSQIDKFDHILNYADCVLLKKWLNEKKLW
jgi:hypothetical protein